MIFPLNFFIHNPVFSKESRWQEVPSTYYGREWWDKQNVNQHQYGEIKVRTKFKPKKKNKSLYVEETLYVMQIDCKENLYRDTSVNGFPRLNSNSASPNADALINIVMNEVCSEESM